MVKIEELLGNKYVDYELLNNVEKTSYILESELWEQNFKSYFKEFIVNMWQVRKQNCMAMTHALINFSLNPHLGVPLGLRGKGIVRR